MKQTNLSGDTIHHIRTDAKLISEWKRINVVCPYCLYRGSLDKFAITKIKAKQGKKISTSMCKCPSCLITLFKKTLLLISNMSMEGYAYWFWGNIFTPWGIHDRVDWIRLKERLLLHTCENRNIFWDVYHIYKESPDKDKVTDIWNTKKEEKRKNKSFFT